MKRQPCPICRTALWVQFTFHAGKFVCGQCGTFFKTTEPPCESISTEPGKETVTLTKSERETLSKANRICQALDRHEPEGGSTDPLNAAAALCGILDRYREPEPAAVAPAVDDELANVFANLDDCDNVTEVNEIEELADTESWTDEQRATIRTHCAARRTAIRATRGDKANAEISAG